MSEPEGRGAGAEGTAGQAADSPDVVLRDYDPFARAALEPFGFPVEARLSLLSLSENATYRVDDPRDGRTAVLRVHRTGYHPPGAVASELAWLQALRRDEGLLTPEVFAAADGREVVDVTIGAVTRQTVLFEFLDGTEPPEEHLAEKFELLGEICGRMHRHSSGWARPASFVRFSWDFDCCVGQAGRWGRWEDGIGVGPEELAVLGRAAAVMRDRLRRFGSGPERFGLIHADMRLANLLVSGSDIQVIDFDDCGFGWFLFDLGASLSFFEHDPRVPALCDAWQRGYRRVRPLPAADAAEIPTFVLLRRLQLVAWVGSHRFADSARDLGAEFTRGACELAERYLLSYS
ncbi:MAG TPA: phosphotransferase [Streptosporangiaceae bacterium]|nr:phosphotransferase [Streptosporangiaceae bacterium]